jgi:hypothetical protein
MKIYSYCFIFFLVFSALATNGQTTYVSTATGGNWSAGTTWVGGVSPGANCGNCVIDIVSGATVTVDMPVDLNGGASADTVVVQGTASLIVNQPLELDNNSWLLVGNTPTSTASLIVNQEIDLTNVSNLRIADSTSFINATASDPGTGLVNSGAGGSGIYYINSVGPPVTFSLLLNSGGYQTYPIPGQNLNCGGGSQNTCVTGIVFGPALSANIVGPGGVFFSFTTLPVQLIKFAAVLNSSKTVDLSWATAQEVNSNYFSVQRSSDGASFEEIGKVKANGFSSITSNYAFTDPSILLGTAYYRLQIVDLDGKVSYSNVLTVSTDPSGNSILIFSNPFIDQVRLQITISAADKISLFLSDITGRSVLKEIFSAGAGSNFINLQPGPGVSSGVYFLNIRSNTINTTIKLLKQDR